MVLLESGRLTRCPKYQLAELVRQIRCGSNYKVNTFVAMDRSIDFYYSDFEKYLVLWILRATAATFFVGWAIATDHSTFNLGSGGSAALESAIFLARR